MHEGGAWNAAALVQHGESSLHLPGRELGRRPFIERPLMSYATSPDGLYLATAPIMGGLIRHTGIIDIGNRMGYPGLPAGAEPVVIHLPLSGLKSERLSRTKLSWTMFEDSIARSRYGSESWK